MLLQLQAAVCLGQGQRYLSGKPFPSLQPFAHPPLPSCRKALGKCCLSQGSPQGQHKCSWKTRAQWGHHHTSQSHWTVPSCSHVPPAPPANRSASQTTAQLLPPALGGTNLLNKDLTDVVLPCPKVELQITSPLSNLQLNCGEAVPALSPTCGCNHPHHNCTWTSFLKSTLFIIRADSFKAFI